MKLTLFFFFLLFSINVLFGQTPSTLSLQGVLRDASGNAVADGDYSMTFKMYDVATGGTALWSEDQTARVNNAVYSVQLGAVTALNLAFDKQYYVGITIGGTELTPRMVLTAAPYAMGLKGTSNIFSGGGGVGIGTTSVGGGYVLIVKGYPKFENETDFYAGSANESAARFFGNALFKDKATLETDKNFNSYGRFNMYSNEWAGNRGIQFYNQAAGAANPEPGLRIQRGATYDNRHNKMEFVTPDATALPNGGFEFAQWGGATLMKIDNGTGKVTIPGTLNVTGTLNYKNMPVVRAKTKIKVLAAMQYNNQVWRGTEGMSISRSDAGVYLISMPADVSWDDIISVQATCVQAGIASGDGTRFVILKDGSSGTNQFHIVQKAYNSNTNTDFPFTFEIVALSY